MAADTANTFEVFKPMLIEQMKNSDRVQTSEVKQGIELVGETKNHKVDLYWEFQKAGRKYQAIIDTNNLTNWIYGETLDQSIRDLSDLPSKPKKIFLSGLSQNSLIGRFAEDNNIILMELSKLKERPLSTCHKIYNFNIDIYQPHIRIDRLNQDEMWNRRESQRLGISLREASKIKIGLSDETIFYDEYGKEIITAFLLSNSLVPKGYDEMPEEKIIHTFKNPTFIKTSDPRIEKIKINSIEFIISKTHENIRFSIDFIDLVEYIIEKIVGSVNTLILDEMMKNNPSIKGYSSTLKDELIGGKPSGRKAIRIYVSKKKHKSELSKDLVLPDELNGFPIDVVEIGNPKLLQGPKMPTEQIRPLVGGISVGINTCIRNAGTLGYFVKDKDGHWYALSCQHVFGDITNMPILQPGSFDEGKYPDDSVAKLTRSINNGFADAAIARLDAFAMPYMNGLPSPVGIGTAEDRMTVVKSGRSTKITKGEISDTTAVFEMNGTIWKDQIIINSNRLDPFANHGDSGSLIIDEKTNQAIGLLFSGDETIGICFANHIIDVLQILDVELVRPTDDFR